MGRVMLAVSAIVAVLAWAGCARLWRQSSSGPPWWRRRYLTRREDLRIGAGFLALAALGVSLAYGFGPLGRTHDVQRARGHVTAQTPAATAVALTGTNPPRVRHVVWVPRRLLHAKLGELVVLYRDEGALLPRGSDSDTNAPVLGEILLLGAAVTLLASMHPETSWRMVSYD